MTYLALNLPRKTFFNDVVFYFSNCVFCILTGKMFNEDAKKRLNKKEVFDFGDFKAVDAFLF